jgi:predicted glycoside hydrolase/deacetylase ChbG (UPF0249 family)
MRHLIVTADDFGLTEGVCAGIVECLDQGIVTATSVMVCVPGIDEKLERWRNRIAGRAGLHLQLTQGTPCSDPRDVPSLVDETGRFPESFADVRRPDPEHIEREWHAQAARLRAMGIEPAHLDSHHHVHRNPAVFESYLKIAAHYGVPARTGSRIVTSQLRRAGILSADYCEAGWFGGDLSPAGFSALTGAAFSRIRGSGTVEVVCHPAYPDADLARLSKYSAERAIERETLTSSEVVALLDLQGIALARAAYAVA